MYKILGLMGAIGSGKDFIADALIEEYKYISSTLNPVKMRFSTALVLHVIDYYQKSHDLLPFFQDREWKEKPQFPHPTQKDLLISPREALKYFGNLEREKNPNCWVDSLHARIIKTMFDYSRDNNWLFIVSDVRYQNEVDYIVNSGGTILPIRNKLAEDREMSKESCPSEELVRKYIQRGYRDFELVFNNDKSGLDPNVVRAYALAFLPCSFL